MIAYAIDYHLRNNTTARHISIEAKNLKSAKKKIGKKHHYKDGRMVYIDRVFIVGYL